MTLSASPDPFDIFVEKVQKRGLGSQGIGYEPALFLDGDRFLHYIRHNYDEFDIATYSYSQGGKGLRIRRLITGLRQRCLHCLTYKEHKYFPNNHIKLYICYRVERHRRRPPTRSATVVYVGSQNLVFGTNLNLMYLVRPEHIQPLVKFFDDLWQSI